jgi:hypothetical protein
VSVSRNRANVGYSLVATVLAFAILLVAGVSLLHLVTPLSARIIKFPSVRPRTPEEPDVPDVVASRRLLKQAEAIEVAAALIASALITPDDLDLSPDEKKKLVARLHDAATFQRCFGEALS